MKTRFSSLVTVKKNSMQESERVVQNANKNLQNAQIALEDSLEQLKQIPLPIQGIVSDFLANRKLLDVQRTLIKHNKEWVSYTQEELSKAKKHLKEAMIEYEKFKYLHLQEVEKFLNARKMKEAKDLDEVALITHGRKSKKKVS